MINQYETVFIINPILSDAEVKEAVDKIKNLITSNEGEILHYEDWGLKKLAYPIKNKSTGFYHLLEFNADTQFVLKLETEFRRSENYIRFLTFRMDKNEKEYAEKRKARLNLKSKEKKEA